MDTCARLDRNQCAGRRLKEKGQMTITPEGDVGSVEVMKTSGHRALDLAALRVVQDAAPFPKRRRWIFRAHVHLKFYYF
jgi:TonB family protein